MTEAMARAKQTEWLHICLLLHDVKQHAIEYGEASKAVRMGWTAVQMPQKRLK